MSGLYEDERDINHEILFSGNSLKIGKIQWYLSKADFEMYKKRHVKGITGDLSDFGKEVIDEIQWWIFKKETDVKELENQTKIALNSVQKLKEASLSLKDRFIARSYGELISKIKEFLESHAEEIDDLLDYVIWLNKKDILAPSILYTYRVWGSTRLSDRYIPITVSTIDIENSKVIGRTTEIALGLRSKFGLTINSVYSDICSDMAESIDPEEYSGPILPSESYLIARTSHEVLDELATTFEKIRDSLRNILLEIERFRAQAELLTDESFWKSFIIKAKDKKMENELWDFKETLDIWHSPPEEKGNRAVNFCEQVAAIANNKGGVLIIGITNFFPRTIVGVEDFENKLKTTKSVLMRYINYSIDFVHFQALTLLDIKGEEKNCLVIAIAQTKDKVPVKDTTGKFSYPLRMETGMERVEPEKIRELKRNIKVDNYDFLLTLNKLIQVE